MGMGGFIRNLIRGKNAMMPIEDIIKLEIEDWLTSEKLQQMKESERYYRGKHDILDYERKGIGPGGQPITLPHMANNRLIHMHMRKLTDQKAGYLFSRRMTLQTDDMNYLKALEELLGDEFQTLLKRLGKEAVKKGIAWLHVYYDEQGKLSFKRMISEEIIPLWRDNDHTQLDALIRIYPVIVYEGREKKIINKVQYWTTDGVQHYEYRDGTLIPDVEVDMNSHMTVKTAQGQVQPLNWQRIPFIPFKYNETEQTLLEFIKTLIDDYDRRRSQTSNDIEDKPKSIYKLKNYGEPLGEFRKNLALYQAVNIEDTSEVPGDLDTLDINIETEATVPHIEQLRKDIYEMGRGVDMRPDKVGNSPSGKALRILYNDLELDANDIEAEFQGSLDQLLWFIDQHLKNTGQGEFSTSKVTFVFNRDMLIDESDIIENCKNSTGIISDETIIANHPWVTNIHEEVQRLKKQRDEDPTGYEDLVGDESDDSDQDDQS